MLRQNRCFVRGVRQFSSHLTKYHDCHGICTVSPLDAALTLRLAKNTQLDTEVLRLPRDNDDEGLQSAARATDATHPSKTMQKYCGCHTKRLSTC